MHETALFSHRGLAPLNVPNSCPNVFPSFFLIFFFLSLPGDTTYYLFTTSPVLSVNKTLHHAENSLLLIIAQK